MEGEGANGEGVRESGEIERKKEYDINIKQIYAQNSERAIIYSPTFTVNSHIFIMNTVVSGIQW